MKIVIKIILILTIITNLYITYFVINKIEHLEKSFFALERHLTQNYPNVNNSEVDVSNLSHYMDDKYIFQGVVKNMFVAFDIVQIALWLSFILLIIVIVLNVMKFVFYKIKSKNLKDK